MLHPFHFEIRPLKWGRSEFFSTKTRPRTPKLFISGFPKAACKYFKNFGPWTADVQGPLINLCLMNVITTALKGRPARIPAPSGRVEPPLVAQASSPAGCRGVSPRPTVTPSSNPGWSAQNPAPLLWPKLQVSRTFSLPAPMCSTKNSQVVADKIVNKFMEFAANKTCTKNYSSSHW
jgi:hypothetical protein